MSVIGEHRTWECSLTFDYIPISTDTLNLIFDEASAPSNAVSLKIDIRCDREDECENDEPYEEEPDEATDN